MTGYEIDWIREFGRIADFRVEKYKLKSNNKLYYLISNFSKTYLVVNGPFDSPAERDAAIVEDVKRRQLV